MKNQRKEESAFTLEPVDPGLLDVTSASRSFRISRAAFWKWSLLPTRRDGRRKLYALGDVISARLAHEEASQEPSETPAERLEARRQLLAEQVEAAGLRLDAARREYVRRDQAREALERAGETVAAILEGVPDEIIRENSRLAGARHVLERQLDRAAALWRALPACLD